MAARRSAFRATSGLFVFALVVTAAACTKEAAAPDAAVTELTPVIASSELAVGENRFILGILDQDQQEVIGAEVSFRFFKLDGDLGELRGEAEATPLTVEKSYTHTHADGTVEAHGAGKTGVYVAYPTFDEAGPWGVEVIATVNGKRFDPLNVPFSVLEEASTVAVGEPAPRSQTLTLNDVEDVAEIDTSDPPIPEMHELTIAEAVTSGKPTVIVFATPAFCVSRICGPTKQIVDDLFQQYQGQANFVHVEPYDLARARAGEGLFPIAAAEEWGLQSEPWVFIVDAEGTVLAKFEGVVTADELRQALNPLLNTAGAGSGYGY